MGMVMGNGDWVASGSIGLGIHSFDGVVVVLGYFLELGGSRNGNCGMSVALFGAWM